jgi:hypothetical protein
MITSIPEGARTGNRVSYFSAVPYLVVSHRRRLLPAAGADEHVFRPVQPGRDEFDDSIPVHRHPRHDPGLRGRLVGLRLRGVGNWHVHALGVARNPRRYLGAVWLLVWLELLHGVLDDIYLIARGYDMVGYLVFIAIHLAIIVTGVLFGRQAEAEAAGR